MDTKQNAREIIRFGKPERIIGGPPIRWINYFGCNHEGYDGGGHHLPVGSQWKDIWGVEWHREHEGVMGFPRGNPLADLPTALRTYAWPDPNDERICSLIDMQAQECDRTTTFPCASNRDCLWEKSYMLVGMENMMCYFYTEPQAVKELLHRIMDFQLAMASHYVKAGVEMMHASDDLGTQTGLLLSREIILEFLVPEYKRLFDFYNRNNVIIMFHSCGHIMPILDIFMDLGVDVLNPLQSSANDLAEVRRITQGKMALHGGVGSALLMDGPVDAIRNEAIRLMRLLGSNGGYFCAPDQGMPWPREHIEALNKAVDECGLYPLARG